MQDIPTPMLVVAAALAAADGRVLMQRRPLGKEHGGLWEFPGGKVEPGESAEDALVRELEEELRIRVHPVDLAPLTFATREATSDRRGMVLLLYRCLRWEGEPRCDTDADLAWTAPADLAALPMPPLDVALAKFVLALSK